MPSNEYHFITHWRVAGTAEEVYDILSNATDLARWWPAVYLDVQVLNPGEKNGVGKIVSLYTKGWLPYTLRWQFRVTEVDRPAGFSLEAWGDFTGGGIWKLVQDGDSVNVTYDWKIRADKTLLRHLSWALKPIFAANHRWAMAKGEESLKVEIERRRAPNAIGAKQPPGPTFPHNWRYRRRLRVNDNDANHASV
ncbi:MAG: SRPBCC family protein [bacterium]